MFLLYLQLFFYLQNSLKIYSTDGINFYGLMMDENVFELIDEKIDAVREYLSLYNTSEDYKLLKKGFKRLVSLTKEYNLKSLALSYISTFLNLALRYAAVYSLRIRVREKSYFKRRKQIRDYKNTLSLCKRVVMPFYKTDINLIVSTILRTFTDENFWAMEPFCVGLIKKLSISETFNLKIVNAAIDLIENPSISITDLQDILKIFYDLLGYGIWPTYDNITAIRLLEMHYKSVISPWGAQSFCLHKSFEGSIKKLLIQSSNANLLLYIEISLENFVKEEKLTDDKLRKLSFSVEMATSSHQMESLYISFRYTIFRNILLLISSENQLKCFLGNMFFHNILDCHNNVQQFTDCKIFFAEVKYDIKIRSTATVERDFIEQYRKEIHVTFLTALQRHKDDVNNLQYLYTSLALLLTEIPCDYTAAVLVCLMMNVQKLILSDPTISPEASHRLHGIIIAVMSLVCWVTKAKCFYSYLNKVVKQRANSAPFLNPPLRKNYEYAKHHILWNKPEFFFTNWEVRYALWKRFKVIETLDTVMKASEEFIPATAQILKPYGCSADNVFFTF